MPGNKKDMGEHEEHLWCGTPDCCQQCEQLELFPVSIYTKDTKEETTSSRLDTIKEVSIAFID